MNCDVSFITGLSNLEKLIYSSGPSDAVSMLPLLARVSSIAALRIKQGTGSESFSVESGLGLVDDNKWTGFYRALDFLLISGSGLF